MKNLSSPFLSIGTEKGLESPASKSESSNSYDKRHPKVCTESNTTPLKEDKDQTIYKNKVFFH